MTGEGIPMGMRFAQSTGMEQSTGHRSTAELRALDPDLPIIAARAAMQLDLVIGSIQHNEQLGQLRTDAIKQLATMISNLNGNAAGGLKCLVDPLTANLLSKAYSDASRAQLNSLQELEGAMKKLGQMLVEASTQEVPQQDPVRALTLVRDFCVKLSEYAASKRQLAYGEKPVPAFRR